jgi:flavin-binding protein dodecin
MQNEFLIIANNPFRFRLFMLWKLPAAFLSGLRVRKATLDRAAVSISLHWLSQNPFRSIYFASLAMAAEMSTGLLAMSRIYKRTPAISMLVVSMESQFFKKATGTIEFVCNDGPSFESAIQEAIDRGESTTLTATSTGTNQQGEVVARFVFTWSFKRK